MLIIVDLLCSLKEFEEGKQEVMCQEIANLRDKVRGDLFVKNLSDIHSTMVVKGARVVIWKAMLKYCLLMLSCCVVQLVEVLDGKLAQDQGLVPLTTPQVLTFSLYGK